MDDKLLKPRPLQDNGAASHTVSSSGNSEPGPAYYGNGGSLGYVSRHSQATG